MGKFTTNKKVYRVDPILRNRGGAAAGDDDQNNNNNDINEELNNDPLLKSIYGNSNLLMNQELNLQDPTTLLQLMDSPETTERDFAFRNIAELVLENQSFATRLLEKDNLKKVIHRLYDQDIQIRLSVIGTFRNLTIDNENYCEILIKNDILTPVLSILQQGLTSLISIPENEIKGNKSLEIQHTLNQIISLLTNISEISVKGFEIISQELKQTTTLLFQILTNYLKLMGDLPNTIAEFLAVLTDDNPIVTQNLNRDLLMVLFDLITKSTNMNMKLRILISISLLNIGSQYGQSEMVVSNITPILLSTFSFSGVTGLKSICEMVEQCNQLKKQHENVIPKSNPMDINTDIDISTSHHIETTIANADIEADGNQEMKEGQDEEEDEGEPIVEPDHTDSATKAIIDKILDMEKQISTHLESWKDSISAQQSAIEIFTNLLSTSSLDDTKTDNVYDDDDKFLDVEDGPQGGNSNSIELSPIIKYLSTTNLCQNLMELIHNISSQDFQPIAKNYSELLPNIVTIKLIQKTAITCLSNLLIMYLPSDQTVQTALWDLLIKITGQLMSNGASTKLDVEQLEMITSSIWSMMRSNNFGFTKDSDIKQLAELALKSSETIKVNVIGIIGISGQKPFCQPFLKDIGQFLLYSLKDESAEVISESLNSIFDIFAEPPVNSIFNELSMLQHLEQFLPILKNKIKLEKKKLDRALLDRLDESRINLSRFITYKKNQK
eukprot:gene8259-10149_t